MRSIEEIKTDISLASSINDVDALRKLSDEIAKIGTEEAAAESEVVAGLVSRLSGSYDESLAHLERALAISRDVGNTNVEASALMNLGVVSESTGHPDKALELMPQALELYQQLGDRRNEASSLLNIGLVYKGLGDNAKAYGFYRRALTIYEDLNDQAGVGRAHGNLGAIFLSAGSLPEALEEFQKALDSGEESGAKHLIARMRASIGHVLFTEGDIDGAAEQYQSALKLFEDLESPSDVARVTSSIGSVEFERGDHRKAFEIYRRALSTSEELGELDMIAMLLSNLIATHLELNELDEADLLLDRQNEMANQSPSVKTAWHNSRSRIARLKGDFERARTELEQALQIALDHGHHSSIMSCHRELRDVSKDLRDFDAYVRHSEEYHRLADEVHGNKAAQRIAMMRAERAIEAERVEHEKQRQLLYGALPKEIAHRLLDGDDVSGDEHSHAIVLFLDITDSTHHSAGVPAKRVVGLLAEMFSRFDAIAERFGLIKIKTIGDAYMAVAFPNDEDFDSPERRTAQAAIEMMASEFKWPDGKDVRYRIGIHCGPVVAGVIGTQRLQYDVWGDTVNTASRMESTAEPGRIQVSETFAEALDPIDDAVGLVQRGVIDVKGKGKMKTYWLSAE